MTSLSILIDDSTRQRIIDRFINVVRPELEAGRELDIMLTAGELSSLTKAFANWRRKVQPGMRHTFSPLAPPFRLDQSNSACTPRIMIGKKPTGVKRWLNLNAHGDLVGGPLKGRPFEADIDFLNLEAAVCLDWLPTSKRPHAALICTMLKCAEYRFCVDLNHGPTLLGKSATNTNCRSHTSAVLRLG
jgi:hypothetical protein